MDVRAIRLRTFARLGLGGSYDPDYPIDDWYYDTDPEEGDR